MDLKQPNVEPPLVRPRRIWLRRCLWSFAGFVLLVAFAPTIVAHTPLLNYVLRIVVADHNTQVTTRATSLGWFSPLEIDGLEIVDLRGGSQIRIARIEAEQSWFQMLWHAPDFGSLTLESPRVEVVTSDSPKGSRLGTGRPARGLKPTFRADVRDLSVIVREKADQPPALDMSSLDVAVQIAREGESRVLTVEPTQLLNQLELTVEMCHRGLQLVAPVLADAANVEGQVSLRLDRLRVLLDPPANEKPQADVEGHLILHRVSAGVRNPLLGEIAQVVSKLLRVKMPSQVKLTDQSEIHFFVRDGRVFHEGLAFGLPEISPELQIRTQGSVGMDRSLDMLVEVPIPLDLIHDGPILRMLSERPLRLHVRGTLDKPVLALPDDRQWQKELAERLLPAVTGAGAAADGSNRGDANLQAVQPLVDSLLDTTAKLLERRRQVVAEKKAQGEPEGPPATRLLDRLRAIREGVRNPPATEPEAPPTPPRESPANRGVEF